MREIPLKYGCNPNQPDARVLFEGPGAMPLTVANGAPSYINVLDGLRAWRLVRDLKAVTGKASAASFKHVSPAGTAVAATGELSAELRAVNFYGDAELSPAAAAYAKARASDRGASFGDFIAVSEVVDETLAALIKPEVSDGIIAPGYEPAALAVLTGKKGGKYVVMAMDPDYAEPATESRVEMGLTLEQTSNALLPSGELLAEVVTEQQAIPESERETLLVLMTTLKHTQSNSVALGLEGHAVGIGAGQQSRIACTRLCCEKAGRYLLKLHPRSVELAARFKGEVKRSDRVNAIDAYVIWGELSELERDRLRGKVDGAVEPIGQDEAATYLSGVVGMCCASDAFFPFRDNIDRLARSGVKYIAQAGGSVRDADVVAAADEHGMAMAMTGVRLFLH
ncbi:MAG: phosphoribosylaminoimidazolecarboxamide formyltransferase [Planctomycetota bacterium]